MHVLRVEHISADYGNWKGMFDSDPVDRKGKGVRRHQILRAEDDPKLVCIELTFDTAADAHALLAAMGEVWKKVDGTLIFEPKTRIFELAEDHTY